VADTLNEQLPQIICEVAELDEVPDGASFADLGIDSMMAIEIVADVERQYKLEIPESELEDLVNLEAVYEKVRSKLADAA